MEYAKNRYPNLAVPHTHSPKLMTLVELLLLLLIAAIAGGLGQALSGYSLGGCLVSIVVGFVGAILGLWIARSLGLPEPFPLTVGGQAFPLLWAIIGSALFSAVLGLISRQRPAR
jgi:uncharacterized membrane protein YeaQ/YmgE (transglycosylase-associated protein family)